MDAPKQNKVTKMKNADLPAMPIIDDEVSTHEKEIHFGLTKREMFAMEVMKAAISNKEVFEYSDMKNNDFKCALKKFSYEMADIML